MNRAPVPQALPRAYVADRTWFDRWDYSLIVVSVLVAGTGLVMVASASVSIAEQNAGNALYYFWRQAAYLFVALLVSLAVAQTRLKVWRRAGPMILVGGILLLSVVLVPGVGREVNGSTRWLSLGPVNFQPSEPMKLILIVYLAGYLVRRNDEIRSRIGGFLKPVVLLSIIAALLLLEPDYGATVVIFASALGMMFLAGVPMIIFLVWALITTVFFAALVLAAPYRLERLLTFMNPWADPYGSGFQLTQALIAIGRGEWFGVGLGSSVQKLFYLPEAHTDFMFAVLAEELGLAGMVAVIGMFAFIVWRAMEIGARAERVGEIFSAYLCYGIGLLFALQSFINIGVNMGILPTKGLTLPLMSYGGSSLLTNCVAVALLLRADHETRVGT
ncbi:MAG: putative lipid II flippase FtsW [Gammaproteobacteria bacterium]|nr:putative lipid II flippase FtsW [Gammaproteobacteria bacterium]